MGKILGIRDFFKEVEPKISIKSSIGYCLAVTVAELPALTAMGIALGKRALYVKLSGKHIAELCLYKRKT